MSFGNRKELPQQDPFGNRKELPQQDSFGNRKELPQQDSFGNRKELPQRQTFFGRDMVNIAAESMTVSRTALSSLLLLLLHFFSP